MPVKKLVKKAVARPGKDKVFSLTLPGQNEVSVPPTDLLSYCILLYGKKGIGKTEGSASFPNYVNIALEPGRQNIAIRKRDVEVLPAARLQELCDYNDLESCLEHDAWLQIMEYGRMAIEDNTVDGLTFDSIDLAYSACQEHICAVHGVESCFAKVDNVNLWDELRMTFTGYLHFLQKNGIGLLFISHAKEREQEYMEGTEGMTIVGPSCPPACLKIMKQMCDFWFFYCFSDGKRCLIIDDPDMNVDVACGRGFKDAKGNQIDKIFIPKDPAKFYNTIDAKFQSSSSKTEKSNVTTIAKKTVKKAVKKAVKRSIKK